MKHRYSALSAVFLLAGAPLVHAEQAVDLRPSFSLLYSHVFEDSARGTDEGQGAHLSGVWNLSERWGVELGASYHGFDESQQSGIAREWRETGLNLGAQYYLSRQPRFSPYLSLGAGAIRLDDRANDTRTTEPFGQAGVGFTSLLASNFGIRGEALYRYIDVSDDHAIDGSSFGEAVARLGFYVPIGAAPVAASQPAPVAAPPAAGPAPAPRPDAAVLYEFDERIFFGFDSSTLRPEAESILLEAANQIKADRSLKQVEVAGHTCDIGSAQYNLSLSQRRANVVRNFLVERGGIDASVLSVNGYGVTRPKVPNTSVENRQQNRRVELRKID